MPSRLAVAALLLGLLACSDRPLPTAGPAPDAAPLLARGDGEGTVREEGRYLVFMRDDCDAVSWIGFGGCAIQGTVTRTAFLAAVNTIGFHPDWRFDPASLLAKPNAKLLVTNVGGRDHTFTRVAQFGGGFVPPLNRLPDTQTVAPECAAVAGVASAIVPPGASVEVRTDHQGHVGDHLERFQCCIHPWMRTTVHVRHDAPR